MSKSEALIRMNELRKKAEKGSKLEFAGMAGILLLPIGLGLIIAGSRMREKANEEMDEIYREVFIREPMSESFENLDFRPYEGFSEEQVEGFRICNMGNLFDSEFYGKATLQDVRIETSYVTVQDYDRMAKKNKNDGRRENNVTGKSEYLCGKALYRRGVPERGMQARRI